MARELNQELFNSGRPDENETFESSPYSFQGQDRNLQGSSAAQAYRNQAPDRREGQQLALQIETITRRMKEFESRVETMHTKVDEMTGQNRQRFERVQGHFQRQTEMLQSALSDMHTKIAQVVSRLNERKLSESAVKEMVDRHAHVVQNFETRLNQLQKLMSDQELQLIHARSELKQALHELARLKKG